ncbi:hypothetical protein Tco_1305466, partial [Tanacetum coccineum]
MSEEDKEMTSFHIDGGVFFHTHMSKRLKNFGATYQRLMDMVFTKQRGRNVEAYLEEIKVNMKLNPYECIFGMEEGIFLGYMVTTKGIKVDPEKSAELTLHFRDMARGYDDEGIFRWTKRIEKALQKVKKEMCKLPTFIISKEDETLMVCLLLKSETINAMLLT